MARSPYTPEQLAARKAALDADLARYREGSGPTAVEIRDALTIHDWTIHHRMDHDESWLEGLVIGHPRLGTARISTAPVVAMDDDQTWCRTEGRLYALGLPAPVLDRDPPSNS